MGLFGRTKKKKQPPTFETHYSLTVFVSENALKIDYSEANKYLCGDLKVLQEDKCIRLIQGKTEIFVISNRSKAYKELVPFITYDVYSVELSKRKGDYGFYYPAKILFMLDREEGNRIAVESLFEGK